MVSTSEKRKLLLDNNEELKKKRERLERGMQKSKLIQNWSKGAMSKYIQSNYNF